MIVICAVSEGHVCICGPTTARGHVDVHGLCYHQQPCGFLWSVLLSETILTSSGQAAARDHVDIHGPYYSGSHIDVFVQKIQLNQHNYTLSQSELQNYRLCKVHTQKLLIFLYTSNYQVAFEFKNSFPYIIKYLTINIGAHTKELHEDNHKTKKIMKELSKCGNCQCSWIGIQYIKTLNFCKLMYRLIPIHCNSNQISASCFMWISKPILKFIWKGNRSRISNLILKKKKTELET